GLHARGGDRERVRRGGLRPAPPRRPDRSRAAALPAHADRQCACARGDRERTGAGPRRRERGLRGHGMTTLAQIGPRRRQTDRLARGLLAAGTLLALVPLALILYYLIIKGVGSWAISFFTTDPTGKLLGD